MLLRIFFFCVCVVIYLEYFFEEGHFIKSIYIFEGGHVIHWIRP
jgi:hypothetical protein